MFSIRRRDRELGEKIFRPSAPVIRAHGKEDDLRVAAGLAHVNNDVPNNPFGDAKNSVPDRCGRSARLERSMPRRESTLRHVSPPHRLAMPRFATNCRKFVQCRRGRPGTARSSPEARYAAMQQSGVQCPFEAT
jgi:hypothetical protein